MKWKCGIYLFDLKQYRASKWHKKCNESLIPKNSLNSTKWGKKTEINHNKIIPEWEYNIIRRMYLYLSIPSIFLCQSTPFITQPKCTVLIDTKFKGASPTCCGTSAPFSGTQKCQASKMKCRWKAIIIRLLHLLSYL